MDENQIIENMTSTSEPQQEKVLTQSEVNKLVGRVKAEAEQKARRQAEMDYQQQLEMLNQNQKQHQVAGHQQVDADAIYQQIQERWNMDQRQRQEEEERRLFSEEASRAESAYHSKIGKGHELYEDFKEVTKDFDPYEFPQLMYLVSGLDNAADVVYEIAKNPTKLATIDNLAQRSPKLAHRELLKLASSISTNKQAQQDANGQSINAPLDRLQPSRVSGSSDKLSIRDLRSQPWLAG